ncbi:hypothetical protein CDL15_Pgr001498 [Punica granatum]|uniref:Root meristem growth factor 9-like n=1 Tax=Punica granatum TaxID=22663 RepID=A0A218X3N3_PUNGR|nr:hypothetical protein CDL15_Pgr001498 [Punica granatum]PKH65184.1 hypothetical protein CRG98_050173 [Punica granatum]
MERVPSRLLVLLFLILCSIFIASTSARSLRTVPAPIEEEKTIKQKSTLTFVQKGEGLASAPDADDFTSMDYTPARKKPPIHNRR